MELLQVYYDLYRYAYNSMRQNGQARFFDDAYTASLKKHWEYLRININTPVKMT